MPAPISIVIPTLNAAQDLPAMLQGVMPLLTAGLVREVVITDGGSTDETLEMAEEVGAVVITGAPGRGGQLRRGVDASAGAWVLVLHADTVLTGDWVRAVSMHLQNDPDRAGYFALQFRASGLFPAWVAGWANWRARVLALPYGDQGLLISRSLYDRVGGYPDIPLMEDVALVRALAGRVVALEGCAQTSAERYERDGWLRRGVHNLVTLALFVLGVAPQRLARRYNRR